jgi:hypothetical protein
VRSGTYADTEDQDSEKLKLIAEFGFGSGNMTNRHLSQAVSGTKVPATQNSTQQKSRVACIGAPTRRNLWFLLKHY